jgi:hypothetical protein
VARVVVNPTVTSDEFNRTFDMNRGWQTDTYRGVTRYRAFGLPEGKRSAFVRLPDGQATIIVLTNDDSAHAAGIADRIADRLLLTKK